MKMKLTVLVTVLGLFAMSGLALAENGEQSQDTTPDDPKDDTIFNFGYDEENRILVWGTSPSDDPDAQSDCVLENGPIDLTYEVGDDGVLVIPSLEDCGVIGVPVEGPNGQVNHGMVMKAFNQAYDGGPGRGCIARSLAQSDLGKGDQQVRVSDVVPEDSEVTAGTVDFETVQADCEHGHRPDKTDKSKKGHGRPDNPGAHGRAHAGRKTGHPGNSGNAPGRNK